MIVLSGANSIIGQNLLPVIRENNQVCSFDLERGDIRDEDFILRLIDEVNPDIFINCARMYNADECEFKRELAYNFNGFAPGVLARICKEKNIKLVQISTSMVFDGNSRKAYSEEDMVSPNSVYGDSSVIAENRIKESGVDYLIFRVPYLFGKEFNLINEYITPLKNNNEINVLKDQLINPTSLKDLSEVILQSISKQLSGTYHFSNEGYVTKADFLRKLIEHYNRLFKDKITTNFKELHFEDYTFSYDQPLFDCLDNSKITKDLGIKLRNWEDALEEHMNDMKRLKKS